MVLQILSQRNTCRTWARCSPAPKAPIFALSHFHALSVPLQDSLCFFRPLNVIPPWACLTVGLPGIAPGGVMTFPRSTWLLIGQLRRSLDAGGITIPCRYVSDLQPIHACKHKEACHRPISSRRSVARLTARTSLCLISPYCPSLALNRMKLPEGSSCRHSDPIRYFVREAPHPVISATVARSRRELAGTCQVLEMCSNFKHI